MTKLRSTSSSIALLFHVLRWPVRPVATVAGALVLSQAAGLAIPTYSAPAFAQEVSGDDGDGDDDEDEDDFEDDDFDGEDPDDDEFDDGDDDFDDPGDFEDPEDGDDDFDDDGSDEDMFGGDDDFEDPEDGDDDFEDPEDSDDLDDEDADDDIDDDDGAETIAEDDEDVDDIDEADDDDRDASDETSAPTGTDREDDEDQGDRSQDVDRQARTDPGQVEFELATGFEPSEYDIDERGFPSRINEVLAFDLGVDELAIARDLGFVLIERRDLRALGGSLARLQAPQELTLPGAVDALNNAMPAAPFDYNHIYLLPEGDAEGEQAGRSMTIGRPQVGDGIRLGVIDTLVDTSHPSLSGQNVTPRDFAGEGERDTSHATAVASILVGEDTSAGYSGLIPGADVFAANVFSLNDGGAPSTNTFAMVEALDWVASRDVDVISISIAGPDSAVFAEAIERAQARGQIIVAAVGNDGPAAPPLFPSSYGDVVGVTAIDLNQRVFRRAGRGEHVDFSAPGVRVRAATTDGDYALMTGTSFATPVVAALVALRANQSAAQKEALLARMSQSVRDLGSPGKDPVFGYGLLVAGGES